MSDSVTWKAVIVRVHVVWRSGMTAQTEIFPQGGDRFLLSRDTHSVYCFRREMAATARMRVVLLLFPCLNREAGFAYLAYSSCGISELRRVKNTACVAG